MVKYQYCAPCFSSHKIRSFTRFIASTISSGMTIDDYINANISKYAVYNKELPGEINSMRNSKFSNIAIELLKESGLL